MANGALNQHSIAVVFLDRVGPALLLEHISLAMELQLTLGRKIDPLTYLNVKQGRLRATGWSSSMA